MAGSDLKRRAAPLLIRDRRFSASECALRGPAPLQGEHNAEILRDWLDLSEEHIQALVQAGVLRDASGSEA